MPSGSRQKDLLGKPIRTRRPKYEAALEKQELRNIPDRADRIRWLSKVIPANSIYAMPLTSMMVFQEARDCFVYGHYVATIVLAASFVEHWLSGILAGSASEQVMTRGLAAIVEHCRENDLLPAVLSDKIDKLRKIRNPFVHLKSFDHPYGLGQRMLKQRTHPDAILLVDAKEAVVTMYSVAAYAQAPIRR